MVRAVITLLEEKTGVLSLRAATASAQGVIAAETGLSQADIQTAFAAGTLPQLIADSGGDVAAVRAAVLAALDGATLQNDLSAADLVDSWFAPGAAP